LDREAVDAVDTEEEMLFTSQLELHSEGQTGPFLISVQNNYVYE
jgi:hypothetical protein